MYPTKFRPTASNFQGKTIEGVRFVITDRDAFSSTRFGLELGVALAKLFPGKMNWAANEKLAGGKKVLAAARGGEDPAQIEQHYAAETESFRLKASSNSCFTELIYEVLTETREQLACSRSFCS